MMVLEEQTGSEFCSIVKVLTDISPPNHSARRTVPLDYYTTATIAIKISLTAITVTVMLKIKNKKSSTKKN